MIWFVGAGCYHPDMLTIGAVKALKQADCILYDHLVNKEFLQYAKADCETICVGKRGHRPSFAQDDIFALLVEKDKQHQNVVRLKGGDPFLFARGSEEMKFVLEHGCDCQYIPGISSAIGALGFAGIPVTQRGLAAGFSVHTMHLQDGRDTLDYKQLAEDPNTKIFFMGSNKVEQLVTNCLAAGMDENTPIALGSHLTYPGQKVLCSTLKEIPDEDRSAYTSPLLIVLGNVVREQPVLDNTSRLSCFGKRILCVSVDEKPWPVESLTLRYGIYPMIRQAAEVRYESESDLDLSSFDSLIFSSVHAVKGLFVHLHRQGRDVRSLIDKKLYAIGNKTKAELLNRGLWCDGTASDYETMKKTLPLSSACYIKGYDAKCDLPSFSCYRVVEIPFSLPDERPDGICVTCPQALRILVKKGIDVRIPLFCFSHKSFKEAKKLGFTEIHPCASCREALLEEVIRTFGGAVCG